MWLQKILIFIVINCVTAQDVTVTTPLGKILGTILRTRLGKPIYAFRGIRYAKPPIAELRFEAPVPVDPWSGMYNATEDGPLCPQNTDDPISEDCLILNVYTTELPENTNNPKRPVIIFIHGGAVISSGGRSNWFGPQYLMDHDIVLVTFNYRLGSLGFISVGQEAPGNNGFKDQAMALKWVQNNIEPFGGDPNSVTLMGHSIGSWSIALHMVSPMSRGLFHKAIALSGLWLANHRFTTNQVDVAKKQARVVGCPDSSAQEILDCLRTKSAEELGRSSVRLKEFGSDPTLVFLPVVEEDFGQERFLTDDPMKLFRDGEFEKIPIIAGIVKDEAAEKAHEKLWNENLLNLFNNDFQTYAPYAFAYDNTSINNGEISRKLRNFYFGDDPICDATEKSLTELYSDANFGFPVDRTVNIIAEKNTEPIYYYHFVYRGPYSHFYIPGTNTSYGVVHGDDLIYSLYNSSFPIFDSSSSENQKVNELTTLWTTFATNGNTNFNWEPYNKETKKYMEIGEKFVLKRNLNEGRYSFWETLTPLLLY